MTNMLPRDRAELITAEHAAGKSFREIAAAYGHSTQTVRDYVLGRRTPGEPAARDDDFAPFAAYRTAALIESNPRSVTETSPQALFQAAAYPDAVAAACASRKSLP